VTVSPGAGYEDALEGGAAAASFGLKPYEYRVLKKATTAR
jgi:hypothetical protein